MTIDSPLLSAIWQLGLALLMVLLGVVVLFRGRRLPWLFSGAAAFLLGILLVQLLEQIFGSSADESSRLTWQTIIPVGAAILGALSGRYRQTVAYGVIGLATGGALGIWMAQMMQPDDAVLYFWSVVPIILVMALGMLFVIRFGEVALIILSAGVGARLILNGLSLPDDSSLAAALALAAAIAGLVVQYHDYLVELRAAHREETGVLVSDAAEGVSIN